VRKLLFLPGLLFVLGVCACLLYPSSSRAASPSNMALPQLTPTPAPTVSPTVVVSQCPLVWTQVDSSPRYAILRDIDARTYGDSWAITDTGILRWNGTLWTSLPYPTPDDANFHTLNTISAWSAHEAWVGGFYEDTTGMEHPLVMRWDGSMWNLLSVTDEQESTLGSEYRINGIVAVDDNLAYAVGGQDYDGTGFDMPGAILQCTSGGCTLQANPGEASRLIDVAATGPNDVWAVGDTTENGPQQLDPRVEHYDGITWSLVTVPAIGRAIAVTAIAPGDAWILGTELLLHWHNANWTTFPGLPYFNHITSTAPNDVWASSTAGAGPDAGVWHWDGVSWTHAYTLPGFPAPVINSISAHAPDDVWLVARKETSPIEYAFYRYSPLPQFTDVPPASTFYDYVQPLACRGAITGYPCGGDTEPCDPGNHPYFRPQNNVTRGQLSKIVALSAGFEPISNIETFEDVPMGSTFHPYIQALYVHGATTGYPCGGPGEPCNPPSNRPYFRPSATSTRAQISKIVALSAGYIDPVGSQTFEDVPPGSTFHVWIENLATRGIITGYPCGSPGEPCNPSTNRPYFRPTSNVTRGQISKIAVSAFFP
jgi:hypothetical protein